MLGIRLFFKLNPRPTGFLRGSMFANEKNGPAEWLKALSPLISLEEDISEQ